MSWRAGLSAYNWIDLGSTALTASAAALTAPVDNVKAYEAALPWIAPNLSLTSGSCSFTAVFDRPRRVSCLGFLAPERVDDSLDPDFDPLIAPGDTVRWLLSSAADAASGDIWDSTVVACGVDPTKGVHGVLVPWPSGVEPICRRVDLTFRRIALPATPRDVARFGRIWAGPFRHFETNHDWGAEIGWEKDELDHDVRAWAGEFGFVPETAAHDSFALSELQQISQQASTTRQVFFWPRTDRPADGFFARFQTRGKFRSRFISNMSSGSAGLVAAWAPALREDWLGI
jgi:hypothetical protein